MTFLGFYFRHLLNRFYKVLILSPNNSIVLKLGFVEKR
ncbi:hypothetical protein A33Q_1253 [Indibacter alkaliphilus LW1]|uniref:Uncharacterized protein n=1 Tax=Indibacter alkaliphilus (strain CCUG 57479 / KCTC 22604 / LW1) TaxID=1189612 RepID=S2DI08_INDAL|nr:hypothetical protein A33Q_1253 [Indibacter alkaliphilus LW1]